MKKRIVIIGGGISGLATLHYLNRKYTGRADMEISLFEKSARLGGTIRTISEEGCLFETGPNGFLDSKPRTLQFIDDLRLEGSVVKAAKEADVRYISLHQLLHRVPTDPKAFFQSKLLNPLDKLRLFQEPFVPKGDNPTETVYEFGQRRFGRRVAQVFLDPMISGIYAGDAKQINLKAAFPKVYQWEHEYGSLFRAMVKMKGKQKAGNGQKQKKTKARLTSFQHGMSEIIHALGKKYDHQIFLDQNIKTVSHNRDEFVIYSDDKQYRADVLVVSTPAYSAAQLIAGYNPRLADALKNISYAPVVVVGLVLPLDAFHKKPEGFGYLIPSSEKKEVLGVLFESNIFPNRCPKDHVLLRVMMGGATKPNILKKSQTELIDLARAEVASSLQVHVNAKKAFFTAWSKAIPQYDGMYIQMQEKVEQALKESPNLHLVANYRNGIALNDCVENAFKTAEHIFQ